MNLTLKPSSSDACRNKAFLWCLLLSSSHRTSSWPRNSSILVLPGCCARTSSWPSWGRGVKVMRASDDWELEFVLWNRIRSTVGIIKLSQMRCQLVIWLIHKPDLPRGSVCRMWGDFFVFFFVFPSKRNYVSVIVWLFYPFDHLYPGSVFEDFLFQSELTPSSCLQPLEAGYCAHLRCHGDVVFKPG